MRGYDPTKDYDDDDHDRDKKVRVYGVSTKAARKPRKRRKGLALFWWEFRTSLKTVIVLGGAWYLFLVWRG